VKAIPAAGNVLSRAFHVERNGEPLTGRERTCAVPHGGGEQDQLAWLWFNQANRRKWKTEFSCLPKA
jgi:hypothetical protein